MSVSLQLAPGDGWLCRRDDGVLYTGGDWSEALDAFAEAADAVTGRDAVTAAAAGASFDVPAFVVVTWSGRVECAVFGDVEVHTDDPTAPMLTAAGSGTWLERRLTIGNGPLGVRAGAPANERSRLDRGVVPAGGFEVHVDAPIQAAEQTPTGAEPSPAPTSSTDPAPANNQPPTSPSEAANGGELDDELTMSASDFAQAREAATSDGPAAAAPQPPTSEAEIESRAAGFDALAAAAGDDWMEDSLGLARPRSEHIAEQAQSAESSGADIDAESTWIPGDHDGSGAEPPVGDPSGRLPSLSPPPDSPPPVDPDWMSRPPDPERPVVAAPPLVQARRCPLGHLNPPQSVHCRTCGEPIDPAAEPETTRQPLLANAVLADDTVVPIDGTIVLGRNPDRGAARVGDDARLVTVSASSAVSRTHVALRADEWSLTATDCGSRGGVVVVAPGREPVMLEPWIPQEIAPGDTIYLGGPTSVRIEPVE